jgi:hypothetical protein
MPTKHGLGYRRLVRRPNGAALFGAWCAMVQVLSRHTNPRQGYCTDGGGIADRPYTDTDLEALTDMPASIFADMLQVCASEQVGWLRILQGTTGIPQGTIVPLHSDLDLASDLDSDSNQQPLAPVADQLEYNPEDPPGEQKEEKTEDHPGRPKTIEGRAAKLSAYVTRAINQINGVPTMHNRPDLCHAMIEVGKADGFDNVVLYFFDLVYGYAEYKDELRKPISINWLHRDWEDRLAQIRAIHQQKTGSARSIADDLGAKWGHLMAKQGCEQ